MTGFDAELYLRALGERELASGLDVAHERLNGRGQLSEAAAALAVAGVIDTPRAQAIAAGYASASELRSGAHSSQARRRARVMARAADPAPAEPLPARRVFRLAATIPLTRAQLTARTLTLTEDSVRLDGDVVFADNPPGHPGTAPADLTIRTPAGQALTASFSGSWGGGHADGRFEAEATVDPDLKWIEIEGTRIGALDPVTPPPVRIEELAPERIFMRYLWQILSDFGDRHGQTGGVPAASEALIAAGLITRDDPELEAVLWVADGSAQRMPPHHGPAGPQPSPPGMPEAMPARWRALLTQRALTAGPRGTLAVGAVTPLFDGISVAINTVTSGDDGFSVTADTVGIPHPGPMPGGPMLRRRMAWWAHDDRGNHHLGESGSWSSSGDTGGGTIGFGPLDPQARELTLEVSTLAARALITLPLDWDA